MTVPSVDDRTYGFRGTIQFDFLPDRIFRTEKFLGRMLCQCYPLFRFQEIKAAGEYLYPEHMHEARVCIDFIQLPDSAIVYCHFLFKKRKPQASSTSGNCFSKEVDTGYGIVVVTPVSLNADF